MTTTTVRDAISSDTPSETERTLPSDRLCEGCGSSLTDRRPHARYCSARCRTQARRDAQNQRIGAHLDTLAKVVDELLAELGVRNGLTSASAEQGTVADAERKRTTRNVRHGDARKHSEYHYLYQTWMNMKRRCYNPTHAGYQRYGGRRIIVCAEWRNSYEVFRAYVLSNLGHRPRGRSLDRIDNNGNYAPGNIRWATRSEQCCNQRRGSRGPYRRQGCQPLVTDTEVLDAQGSQIALGGRDRGVPQ